MMQRRRFNPKAGGLFAAIFIGVLALAAGCQADTAASSQAPADPIELGFMGSIPVYWGEAGDFGQLLSETGTPHWARRELETAYRLRPIDTLEEANLAGIDYLMLAQPRALSPEENVALDAWVRKGGKLLLFADPLLAAESSFALGDRRRPQGVALLSPILEHWGLDLQFDDSQEPGYRLVNAATAVIPVNLPGFFVRGAEESACVLSAGGLLADCPIEAGRAVVVADADLLDLHEPHPQAPAALLWLVDLSSR